MARLVRSVVVKGPGVRRMASRCIGNRLRVVVVCRRWVRLIVPQRAPRRHACVRRSIQAPASIKSSVTTVDPAVMSTAHAAASPASPASSRLRMAIAAPLVSGE
jgi:hypothetical protein